MMDRCREKKTASNPCCMGQRHQYRAGWGSSGVFDDDEAVPAVIMTMIDTNRYPHAASRGATSEQTAFTGRAAETEEHLHLPSFLPVRTPSLPLLAALEQRYWILV